MRFAKVTFTLVAMSKRPPTVILVHDAWMDGSSWRDVIARVQKNKLNVTAVQIPLVSFTADVRAVQRVMQRQSGRVVLVGHGYGGSVITAAGNGARVAALVYVAGFAPDTGESTRDMLKNAPPSPCLERLEIDADGYIYLSETSFIECFAHELPAIEGRVLAAAQNPLCATALDERVDSAAWRIKPTWYLVTGQDRVLNPYLQRNCARRMSATTIAVHSGHLPLLSDPTSTAAIILDAVDSVRAGSR